MAEFRARFLARAAEDARRIAQALEAGDWATVRDVCHGISGNAGMFGFPDVGAAAQRVERAIGAGTPDKDVHALANPLLLQLEALGENRCE